MASAASPRHTVSDFMALPEGTRAELIGGRIYMTPSPILPHQRLVTGLWEALMHWARPRRAGEAFLAPFDVHLPSGDIVEPDVIFVSTARAGIVQDWIYGVPDLLVEVLSPSNAEHDRDVKRDLYARNGVPEYCIVDPEGRTVEALRLDGKRYAAPGVLGPGDVLTSPLLPEFRLPLRRLFP